MSPAIITPLDAEAAIEAARIDAPEWQPRDGLTHCNRWTRRVAELVGAEMPIALANAVIEWLASPAGLAAGWATATEPVARQHCDAGGLAVATWANPQGHGHIAPLTLAPRGRAGTTFVAHVGQSVRRHATIPGAFGHRAVRFWTYHPSRACTPQA